MHDAPPVTRVLCLGNDLIGDDGVGPAIASELRTRSSVVDLVESMFDGLGLLDDLLDVDRLIVVDAISTGRAPPGSIDVLTEEELAARPGGWQHALGLFDAIRLARALGLHVPREVVLVVIEAGDLLRVGSPLTPEVSDAVPAAADLVERLLAGRH